MKINVTKYMFTEEFKKLRPNSFSYNGLEDLYEYYIELEEDLGDEIELDPIAICCDWMEYEEEEIPKYFFSEGETLEEILEALSDKATVITVDHYGAPNTYLVHNS